MPRRTVCIQGQSKLKVRSRALVVEGTMGETIIPLEDIWVLVIETHQATLTSALLSSISSEGIGLVVCGEDHMPNGLCLPLAAHSRHSAIVEDQLLIAKPLKKQLWRRIVQAKINNQALCLEYLRRDGSQKLRDYALHVTSDDSTGREAVAAAEYFKRYLDSGTRRDGPYSAPLDYGYSIIRAGIGREAVAGGWLVSRGLHHSSELNPFNLVDDLLEPFRPVVDLLVAERVNVDSFDGVARAELAKVFEYLVLVAGKKYSVQTAITREIETLKTAIYKNDAARLELPELLPLSRIEVDRR